MYYPKSYDNKSETLSLHEDIVSSWAVVSVMPLMDSVNAITMKRQHRAYHVLYKPNITFQHYNKYVLTLCQTLNLKLMKNINVTFPPHWPYKTVYITTELSYRQGDLKTNTTHLVSTNGNKKIPHSFKIESSIVETELKLLPHARTHARTHRQIDRQTDRQTRTPPPTHPPTISLSSEIGATQQWTSKHRSNIIHRHHVYFIYENYRDEDLTGDV
jgi:hypothetical protein